MSLLSHEETIAAISTPPGAGGIGVIRISGSLALPILKSIFTPKDKACDFESHRLFYGHIHSSEDGKILDEVLAVFMGLPRSYTREDVVEIHCHGSFLVLQNILELILGSGARLADPGEFTKRAFLNGRIDLTQAEAVIDILSAKTSKGIDMAQEQLSGALYKQIDPIRKSLANMRAHVEVAIDFPDEDIEIIDHSALITQLQVEVSAPLQKLLDNVKRGKLYREGVLLVIAGLPNVGKSSLLNTILQEERALVTSIPGTTRDSIEEVVDIGGMPARLVDTAGIRDDAGEVEVLGIERAKDFINQADLVLFLVDGENGASKEDVDLFRKVSHKPVLLVVNKIDVAVAASIVFSDFGEDVERVEISAKEQLGIEALKKSIFEIITSGSGQWEEQGCAPNLRHQQSLIKAHEACNRVLESLYAGLTNDLIAVDLQDCLDAMAEIVGETTTEDILDVIFEQFCLGK